MNEKLSALMDGELSETEQEQLYAELSHNPELRAAWDRYHLLRSAVRQEGHGLVLTGVADSVAARLQDESQVFELSAWRRVIHKPIGRIAGSLAIAASVAAMAILGLQVLREDGQGLSAKPIVAQTLQPGLGNSLRNAEMDAGLNRYLVEHNEFSPSSSLKGMMSYGRVVSYENDR